MSGFFQNLLQDAVGGFFGSDYLRDYTHASKAFRTNAYQNSPKFKFLFHVAFEINPAAYPAGTGVNFGLNVKTIKLPSYTFDTHQLNQYNRKRVVQTKIKYDNVEISFHDDNGNTIRNMWKAYYQYYYADSNNPRITQGSTIINDTEGKAGGPANNYHARTLYTPSITGDENWGYTGEPAGTVPGGNKIPFFKTIKIFGFNQHKYVCYVLVNPMITRFGHDTYSYAEGNGTMENTMTLDYETVVYDSGSIDGTQPGNIATGFGDNATYDRTVSPISKPGSQASILGQGGLVDAAGGFSDALSSGNILGAIQIAGTSYNTFKNVNLAQVAKSEVIAGITNQVQQTPNRNVQFSLPTFGSTPSGTAGVATPNSFPKTVNGEGSGG